MGSASLTGTEDIAAIASMLAIWVITVRLVL